MLYWTSIRIVPCHHFNYTPSLFAKIFIKIQTQKMEGAFFINKIIFLTPPHNVPTLHKNASPPRRQEIGAMIFEWEIGTEDLFQLI